MEATINIKLDPAQFDTLRRALTDAEEMHMDVVNDGGNSASTRAAARTEAAKIQELLGKLR